MRACSESGAASMVVFPLNSHWVTDLGRPLAGDIACFYHPILGMNARSAAHGPVDKDGSVGKGIHDREGGEKLAY